MSRDPEIFYVRKIWRRHKPDGYNYTMLRHCEPAPFGTYLYATSDQEVFIHDTFNYRKDWAWKRTYKRYSKWIREHEID